MNILINNYKLFNGDCLEVMDYLISQNIKIDCILTDPPYGTTACKWDTIIPFDDMWERLNKLIKPNGAIILFGSEPFTSFLICSNPKNFKYRIIWNKIIPTNFLNAKKCPLKVVEDICIFYKKLPTYNPQMKERTLEEIKETKAKFNKKYKISDTVCENTTYNKHKTIHYEDNVDKKYPTDLIEFNRRNKECNTRNRVHPTQKPIDLLEYLIKTYTNEGEVVLDFTMGSGSTGVACMNTNRKFIGIELDEKYFDISINRIFENYNK